ncbi:glycosyltransferase [Gimesia aquarii]|uniref:glycosyltransferase n=1 Tax=Gimesia aquarii TaxID=2527964 RepID=UPI00119DEE4A|nr:glycosyltransferase [Gimesia aquarii]
MQKKLQNTTAKKIVITTIGSLGDLPPYIAIACGLQARGYEVVFATSKCYQNKIEQLDMKFRAIRPNSDWVNDPELMRRRSNLRMGFIRVGREWLILELRESYEDILAATEGADLLVSMLATYSARLVAEKTGIAWVSIVHIPLGFFSTYDVPIIPLAPVLSKKLRCLGPEFWKPLFWFGKRVSRFMVKPWYRLRAEIGLPPTKEGNPLADSHSPDLVLAPFSKLLADKQPDWPSQTVITSFPFFDKDIKAGLPIKLSRFLDDGPLPSCLRSAQPSRRMQVCSMSTAPLQQNF